MVRAIVEEGHYWMDHYLIYLRAGTTDDDTRLVRVPVTDATIEVDGATCALTSTDRSGRERAINDRADPGARPVHIEAVAATGDFSYARGHFHPNKAPGASLLVALPYFVIYRLERLFGANPDEWWTLTVNAWLTTVFSAGLISAFGCVLVFRLALAFAEGKAVPSLLTAIGFAFGTMFFPLATMLQDQNIAAVLLLASFYLLHGVREAGPAAGQMDDKPAERPGGRIALGGFCAGYAAITNYIAAVAVVALGAYLVWRVRRKDGWKWFALGVLGPLSLLCAYNLACFGTVFTTNYRYMNLAMSRDSGVDAGMLDAPRWDVLLTILFSPFRGLFFTAPVLLVGVYGLVSLFLDGRWKAEARLFVFLIGLYMAFNAGYWSWHGGWTAVPRFLGPAIPFLAAPVVFGFVRLPRASCVLAAVSIAINLLFTAVDPQVPTEFDATANAPVWPQWRRVPLCEYTLPMFLTGRAGPFLDFELNKTMREYAAQLDAAGTRPPERNRLLAAKRQEWEARIQERKMPGSNGPVSGNPTGVYEGWYHSLFPEASRQTEWNSFNVGEFIFPQSRLSLLPLALVCGTLLSGALRIAYKKRV